MARVDELRKGDTRSFHREGGVHLTLLPAPDQPFRFLPRQGDPLSILEWLSQRFLCFVAWIPVYIAIVVSIILFVQVVHPWGLG